MTEPIWPGPDALTERVGNCYTLTLQFAMTNHYRHMAIVHGLMHPSRSDIYRDDPAAPPTFLHAWVEADGVAFDPVARVTASISDYTRKFGAERIAYYPRSVAFDVCRSHGHDGPWDAKSLHIYQTPPTERSA